MAEKLNTWDNQVRPGVESLSLQERLRLHAEHRAEVAATAKAIQDSIDAARYRWLKERLQFSILDWDGQSDTSLVDSKHSLWLLRSTESFRGTNKPPESIDSAIDAAMNEGK